MNDYSALKCDVAVRTFNKLVDALDRVFACKDSFNEQCSKLSDAERAVVTKRINEICKEAEDENGNITSNAIYAIRLCKEE